MKSLSVTIEVTEINQLSTYNSNGDQLYNINSMVQHAIETRQGTIVVCQMDNAEDTHQGVFEMTRDGKHIRSFKGKGKSDEICSYKRRYVAQDNDRDRLFVSDSVKHQVLLFNSQLGPQGVLAKDEANVFKRLCYANEAHLLLICSQYGAVDIYKLCRFSRDH